MMGAVMDEAALIQAARSNDLDAFNRLVLAYQSRVYAIAYRIMGDVDSASDATQEAFISAFKNLHRFRGGSFPSWLFRIVTNACYDELRRRKRRPSSSLDSITEDWDGPQFDESPSMGSAPVSPDRAVERDELQGAIKRCLDQLPPEFKVVAVLVDVQDLNYQEAAEVIGTPIGTIKSRLARARQRLRDCLRTYRELLPAAFRQDSEGM